MLKRELYLGKIRPFMGQNLIKVLTGIRRCGKSVMLELIKEELRAGGVSPAQFIHVNFDSGKLPFEPNAKAVYAFIEKKIQAGAGKFCIFLDEIQELSGWEKMVNSLSVDFDADIYITGSNAKLLSGELATYIAGRYIQIDIHPFSYAEFLEARNLPNARESLEKYLLLGGMPHLNVSQLAGNEAAAYLNDIFDSIVLKDIVARYSIRDVELLRRILLFIISNIGNVFSAKSIVGYLKNAHRPISNETLYNYISYCQAAHLLYLVRRGGLLGKRHLQSNEKIFVADTGFRNALLSRGLDDIGQLLENVVYIELLRRGYDVVVGMVSEQEIDFVATGPRGKLYVQVCYLLADKATAQREFGPFEKIPDNLPKYVVSMDESDLSRDGYIHKNIRDFLLSDEF